MAQLVPIILAGGSGTRLWPLSRQLYPKQFHPVVGEHSLLQQTIMRLRGLDHSAPILVCNQDHRFLVAEQCLAISSPWTSIILEPEARNTAPAIALAAHAALDGHDDPILLVLPSDHHIKDAAAFRSLVQRGAATVGDALMALGLTPSGPETGYGYIEKGSLLEGTTDVHSIRTFVEKPDLERARALYSGGKHFWNSGMFLFRARSYLRELERFRPDIHAATKASYENGRTDLDFFRPGSEFTDSPSDSIDYAVMERTDRAVMLEASIGWSDVGSWAALWELSDQDANGNVQTGDVIQVDSTNSFVMSDHRLVALLGMTDTVVVETKDAVLVANRNRVQDVKKIVDELRSCARDEHESHVKVYRPWGSYESVEAGDRYQVKRISVKPGESLSSQMHHHRSEHWIVVEGTAIVNRGDEEFMLSENQSTYIPLGTKHRLRNPGKVPLELIEVQVGSYLGEDDIVRFDDRYGRR